MEFIRTFREKQQTSRQNTILAEAHDVICLSDFDDTIYIAYNGTPLVPVESTWTQKEILAKLDETRNSFINYKMKQINQPKVAAML